MIGSDSVKYFVEFDGTAWFNDGTTEYDILREQPHFKLMQFTGLLDKKGKEIYEGDVVKVANKGYLNGNKVVVWDYTLLCYVLVWAELYNEWKGAMSGTTFLKVSSGIKCEISGNIYENPELLNSNA